MAEFRGLNQLIMAELVKADEKYGPAPCLMGGFHQIEIELKELERELKLEVKDPIAIEKEAIQVAAMAIKFLRDCT